MTDAVDIAAQEVADGGSALDSPTEFDPFSEIYFNNPYGVYRHLRDNAPAYFNEQYGFWALSRYDDVAPAHDMLSALTQVEVDRGDGELTALTDIEIVEFVTLLGSAGTETVAKLVANGVVIFADHKDQWAALRADRSKIPSAFEELLRYEGPVQYDVRYSMRDVHLHGHTIPKHSPVLVLVGSATRDERVFPSPARFDIERKHSGHNLGFGYGVHSCLGAALARMEGRIALDILLDLIPNYEVDRDGLKRVTMANVAGWSNVPVRSVP